MKKVLSVMFLVALSSQIFAGHYHIEKSNEGVNGFDSVEEKADEKKGIYTLVCSNPGYEKDLYSALRYTKMKEFISETGKVHDIPAIIEMNEILLSDGSDIKIATQLDSDIISVAQLLNGKIVIDIYTGKDALKQKELLKK